MSEDQSQIDAQVIKNLLSSLVDDIYKKIYDDIEEQFQSIIKKIEAYEQQVATIVLAYGEQAVVMEALATQLDYASPEAQKAFTDTLTQQRKKMVETLNEGSKGFVANQDPGLARAINNVVEKKLSDTDQ